MKQITASGTIVIRPRVSKDPHVLLVHRPAYNDWTLPKGKPNPNEYSPVTAIRETLEETAVRARLHVPVNMITYPVGGGLKTVHYWRASPISAGRHRPNNEIDKMAWLTPKVALKRMSYPDERELLLQALSQPVTTPLLIVRHGKAMLRKNWSGRDAARPLDSRGRRQAKDLVALLDAYQVQELASSTSTRCLSTLQPYAKEHRLDIERWATLSEEQGEHNAPAVMKLMQRLAKQAALAGSPMAICGHRPVLPAMLEALGVPSRPMRVGEVAVIHVDAAAKTVAIEWHPPLV